MVKYIKMKPQISIVIVYSTLLIDKGGILSEDIGGFLPLPKNIPISYPKLSYPLHGNDKVLVESNRLHVEKYYSYEIKL